MTRIERYKQQIERKELILESANSALESALADGVESATFGTGTYGARQHYKTLKLDSLVTYITTLESQIDRLERKLRGGGLVNLNAKRR